MKKILTFAGSNSNSSINRKLALFVAGQVEDAEVTALDLNDFELPIYGIDIEVEHGVPKNAHRFLEAIQSVDGIVLSLAEHNGAYSSVFKNIFDWMSRIDGKLWANIPMLLMAASPGGRGGASVLEIAQSRFPRMGGNIIAEFSLPFFDKNFGKEGITDPELKARLEEALSKFKDAIN
jgi:NAD(P)H-dependent FMN reductase